MRPPCRCYSRSYHWGIAVPCHDVTRSHFPVTLRPPHFLPPLGSPSVPHIPLGRISPPPPLISQWVPPTRNFLPLETVLEEAGGSRSCTPEGKSSPDYLTLCWEPSTVSSTPLGGVLHTCPTTPVHTEKPIGTLRCQLHTIACYSIHNNRCQWRQGITLVVFCGKGCVQPCCFLYSLSE